ncbi:MAG: Sjogren's syndrome/scleroderma autoantigen 1 family protein [Candidatus Bathyarchaeota archaeon]
MKMSEGIKRMAEVLKSGATMLSEICPQCNSPLFKLASKEIQCVNCGRKVVIVKADEETVKALLLTTLSALEGTILEKLQEMEQRVKTEKQPEKLQTMMSLVNDCLEALNKIKEAKERS